MGKVHKAFDIAPASAIYISPMWKLGRNALKEGIVKKLIFSCILLSLAGAVALAQTIRVTSPNGDEDWALGSTHAITWTSAGVTGNVRIILFKGGTHIGIVRDNVPVTAGSIDWVVGTYQGGTAVPGTDYKIRIRKMQTEILDSSNRVFTISPAEGAPPPAGSITVKSPNGGEIWWTGNMAYEVRWTLSNIQGSVTIRLKKGGAVITSWTADNTGSSYWMCSGVQDGNDYRIRVESSNGSVFDESDRDFEIKTRTVSTPPPPSTTIPPAISVPAAKTPPVRVQLRIPPEITKFTVENGAPIDDDLFVTLNFQSTGSPTHYRYRMDADWEDWQPLVPGQDATGHLLLFQCDQTVYFQVKNAYGESNVLSDSIRTSTYKTERTISIPEAMRYARPQGFTASVLWKDCSDECAWMVEFVDAYGLMLGFFPDPTKPTQNLRGMKADYELFGGGKLLKEGWEFVSYGMPEIVTIGNTDVPEARGGRVSLMPAAGGRDIKLQIHLWRNFLAETWSFGVRTITLRGPCTEDISEAFKQR
jgi:hypothetical protein